MVETTIPCREKKASAPAAIPVETASAAPQAGEDAGLSRPNPRPLRLAVN